MKCGFVIPVYNHGSALEGVVKNLTTYNLPIIIVDDGNDEANKKQIAAIIEKYPLTSLVTRQKNGGKGLAMKDGALKAHEMGLTHILQIDSDGQHDTSRVKRFLELAEENPNAVICGYPEYDASAPKRRVEGRKIANACIRVVTLNNDIKDAMIGFRIYPLAPYYKLITKHYVIDKRMGYDIDMLVHMSWLGQEIISESVKVVYPSDGISNFRAFRDNVRISFTYARLTIGMVIRLPILLYRKIKKNDK
ncbi:MAG: glycosyltransferase family 2 protein [Treponema sp.]|nr:glycosyltransferase family 2 protein [Treponema sp.]